VRILPAAALVIASSVLAAPARAELAFFANGRSLSIQGHRVEGGALVLMLRGGGEIICEPSLIDRIAPDEVPYPEPRRVDPVIERAAGSAQGSALRQDPRYDGLITSVSARHGVDVQVVRAIIQVESDYRARARSSKGAMGLMQLMPATARQYRVADPYDPPANIEAGVRHLRSLLDRFPLTWALAAYNAGEGAVERFQGIPPYRETREYVRQVLRLIGR
jgi:hypothetical protein